ncbi:MAG: N-acetyltransferase [Phycisphaerae bacterium]|nr:N-acetyltransferase [Phycisphaerae bacterium]
MRIIRCTPSYCDQILAIFNAAIVTSTALYDYQPRTPDMMRAWFEIKETGNYPVVGAITPGGDLMGFGSYGTFRAWPAYQYTVEHSVYVAEKFRRQGVGRRLLEELITLAQSQNYHVLVGAIDSGNRASVSLHRKLGFQYGGTLRQVGFKFGRWLDLEFHQLILPSPRKPEDGNPAT